MTRKEYEEIKNELNKYLPYLNYDNHQGDNWDFGHGGERMLAKTLEILETYVREKK